MGQLIISSELLAQIRLRGDAYGSLRCMQRGDLLLARGLKGGEAKEFADQRYPELAVDDGGAAAGVEMRLTYVLADPPLDPDPLLLEPQMPLGRKRIENEGPPIPQEYLKTILESRDHLLIVGVEHAELLHAQLWPAAKSRVWRRGKVLEPPPRPTADGIDPNLHGTRIGVVGLGSVGSRVASLLVSAGVSDFVFIDSERLEERNLRRHLCGARYVGMLKVDAVTDHLSHTGFEIDARRFARGVPRDDCPELRESLRSCNVLICCADSSAAQQHVNYLAVKLGTPAVIASIKLMPEALGEVLVTRCGDPGCLNCWRLQLERDKLMVRGDLHDPRDYPGPTEATPVGMPAYHLDQVAAVTCDMTSRALAKTAPEVWLNPLQIGVSGFEDLGVQEPKIAAVEPNAKCLVCGTL